MVRPVAVGHDVARPCAHTATDSTSLDRSPFRSPHLAGGDYLTLTKKPVATVSKELGIPDTTLHQWLKNAREHPERPFVGSGKLRVADQEARECQRRIRDLEEENAILKKAMRIFANDRK